MEVETLRNTDLMRHAEQLLERTRALEKRCERLEKDQYATFTWNINRRPLVKKYTCGLIDPEARLMNKMLKQGCVYTSVVHDEKVSQYTFKKKL